MLISGAAVLLKDCDGFGGPCNVISFIGHARICLIASLRTPDVRFCERIAQRT
jgi:hypothetical protein